MPLDLEKNIARGTTDPEIDSVTWIKFSNIMPQDGATCTSCKFGQQMAQLGLVQNLVIRWCHFHCLQSWPPGNVTCIATLPWIALLDFL